MRKDIFISKEKFKEGEKLVRKNLNKLSRILELKKTFIEVYLVEDDFTVHSFKPPKNFPRPDLKDLKNLGEIYLCPDYIRKEIATSSRRGGTPRTHLVFYLIHGLLHLLNYDHERESDRIKMEKKEDELVKQLM